MYHTGTTNLIPDKKGFPEQFKDHRGAQNSAQVRVSLPGEATNTVGNTYGICSYCVCETDHYVVWLIMM